MKKNWAWKLFLHFFFDYPTAFFKINEDQQLHLTEWEDVFSFRGHICLQVDDINAIYWRMKELGVIDIKPWGHVRQLPDGPIQMFVRDPSGNLLRTFFCTGCQNRSQDIRG